MLCVNQTAWTASVDEISNSIRTLDFSIIEENLRGFSDAIRVGRFAYVSPLTPAQHVYSGQLIRISLGDVDIGTTIDDFTLSGGSIRNIVDILDLTKFDPVLKGFSGLFTMGRYLILVPFRNAFEPRNGQRGHGSLVRLNMNSFDLSGLEFIDLPTTTRTQVPSFADVDLRGFSYGFACKCIYFVYNYPVYNCLITLVCSWFLRRFGALLQRFIQWKSCKIHHDRTISIS